MELRQLNYFIAVGEEGTISGAARRLNMSQPPLTAQMHALESELGCALFEHAGRRLRITEAGRTFYARAKAIATLCASTRSEMADLSAGAAGVLHMGVISSVCGAEFIDCRARPKRECGFSSRFILFFSDAAREAATKAPSVRHCAPVPRPAPRWGSAAAAVQCGSIPFQNVP